MLRLHILASGSGGNAAIVENAATGEGVLIDCGICKRDFFARAEEAGFDLGRLRAVVVTHDPGEAAALCDTAILVGESPLRLRRTLRIDPQSRGRSAEELRRLMLAE